MENPFTTLEAAFEVLKVAERPMTSKEIRIKIITEFPGVLSSKTPDRSVNARISQDIKKNRKKSAFKRVGRGLYGLRSSTEKEFDSLSFQRRIFPGDLIFVFNPKKLNKLGSFHGIRPDFNHYSDYLFNWDNFNFFERLIVEKTEKYKQVVSYVIIKYQDSVLQFSRGVITNVKDYLYGYLSIGFGGHVQISDFDLFHSGINGYLYSARREVEEETGIKIEETDEPKIIGILNDDTSSLGRHHIAFIHLYEAHSPTVIKKEKSINQMHFVKISDLGKEFARYEYWSKLCILNYFSEHTTLNCFIENTTPPQSLKKFKVIQVAGFAGSGKTEACSLLENEFNYKAIRASSVLKKLLGYEPDDSISREELQNAGLKFIKQKDGHERLAREIYEIIQSDPKQHWVIDGFRYPKTSEILRKMYGQKIPIIYIETLVDNIYKYYVEREHSNINFNDFQKIVYHPVEREIGRFLHIADIIVYNHSSLEEYINKLREFLLNECNL